MKYLFLTFITLISFSSLAQENAPDTLQKKQPAKLIKKAYSITIPEGWRISDNCTEDLCSLFSPPDTLSKEYDRYVESINITVNKLSSPSYTVDQYAAFSIGYLPKVVKDFTILEKKKLRSNVYRLTYQGFKDYSAQTWRQYYYVKNAKVYIVTFSAETRKYEQFLPLIQPYLDSFKLN